MNYGELSAFYKNLSELQSSGIDLAASFISLQNSHSGLEIRTKLKETHKSLTHGKSLAHSLKKAEFLPPFDILSIQAGEKAGRLVYVLNLLSDRHANLHKAEKYVLSGLFKPYFTFCFALFVPSIPDVFSGSTSLNSYLIKNLTLLFILFGISYGLFYFHRRSIFDYNLAKLRHGILLKIPYIRNMAKKIALQKFSTTLALSLDSGFTSIDAITQSSLASCDDNIQKACLRVIQRIDSGHSFAKATAGESAFSEELKDCFKLGSESGRLSEFLQRYANKLSSEIQIYIDKISTAIPIVTYWLVTAYVLYTIVQFYTSRLNTLNNL